LSGQSVKVGLITDFCTQADRDSIEALLHSTGITSTFISTNDIAKTAGQYDVLWIHGNAMKKFTSQFANDIASYVQTGGKLMLSMDALRLLNVTGIESSPIESRSDSVYDAGYGRSRGLHAFRSHPVFEGMHGGAFISKMRSNFRTPLWGYFDDSKPKEGKVVGIQWTYITFHQDTKLAFEYDYGAGKIFAVGAYIHFAGVNDNRTYLRRFVQNALRYLADPGSFKAGQYWSYRPFTALKTDIPEPRLPIQSIEQRVMLRENEPSLRLYTDNDEEYDMAGKRILWSGQLHGNLKEVWVPPFMAVHDVEIGYMLGDTIRWLSGETAHAMVSPMKIVKEYHTAALLETHTIMQNLPVGRIALLNRSNESYQIVVRFRTNMRLMWPYSAADIGGMRYDFLSGLGSYVVTTENTDEKAVITFSFKSLGEKISVDKDNKDLVIENRFDVKPKTTLNVTITGGDEPLDSLLYYSREYYQLHKQEVMTPQDRKELIAVTSDSTVDVGIKWAIARTKQFFQTTPGIGTSLVAGLSNTSRGWDGNQKVSGRPGYAWYFGRDAVWSSFALLDIGDFDGVKEVLEMLRKYQNLNGKIFHELTTSGVAQYDAADATPLYLILAGKYLRYSGDVAYIKAILPSLQSALAYCQGTDTDGDGLIENTNVGHGWIEGGNLYGSHTELYLAGCWAAALDEMAYIRAHTGSATESKKLQIQAERVRKTINHDFWNPANNTFYTGKMKDGSYMKFPTVLMAVPAYFGLYDKEKGSEALEGLAEKGFTSDWGVRMISDSSQRYNTAGYHEGMVWPLFTGWAALGEYATGHFWPAFYHWRSNVLLFDKTSPGSIEETYNGETFKPQGVCPIQCWSESMAIQPLVEGLLGYKPDAMANTFLLSPAIPWGWDKANFYYLRMADNYLSMRFSRLANNTFAELYSEKPAKIRFEPILPLGTHIGQVMVDSIVQPFSVEYLPGGMRIIPDSAFTINGKLSVHIRQFAGVGLMPPPRPSLGPDSKSTQFTLVSEHHTEDKYTFVIEGIPDTQYLVRLFISGKFESIDGATYDSREGEIIYLKVNIPVSKTKYGRAAVTINL
jgi:glycogen debranching enzyme